MKLNPTSVFAWIGAINLVLMVIAAIAKATGLIGIISCEPPP